MKIKLLLLIILICSFKISTQEIKMSAQEIAKFKETVESQSKTIKTIKTIKKGKTIKTALCTR